MPIQGVQGHSVIFKLESYPAQFAAGKKFFMVYKQETCIFACDVPI